MKIHTAIVPITTGSGIFPLFLLNFLLFNYFDKFFKFFNSFFLVSLKQEIKISTIMRGEIRPVVCLIRKRLMILFVVIFRHNYKGFVRGLLSKPLIFSLLILYDFLRSHLSNSYCSKNYSHFKNISILSNTKGKRGCTTTCWNC